MHYDISVLRAIVRLSRPSRKRLAHALGPNAEALLERLPGQPSDLRASLRRLSSAGLVQVKPFSISLTLAGLAIAVSTMPPRAKAKTAPTGSARAA